MLGGGISPESTFLDSVKPFIPELYGNVSADDTQTTEGEEPGRQS